MDILFIVERRTYDHREFWLCEYSAWKGKVPRHEYEIDGPFITWDEAWQAGEDHMMRFPDSAMWRRPESVPLVSRPYAPFSRETLPGYDERGKA